MKLNQLGQKKLRNHPKNKMLRVDKNNKKKKNKVMILGHKFKQMLKLMEVGVLQILKHYNRILKRK